ncbi:DUF58 domain-containing protein [Flavicella marina]|uniref:DUF58 domain-containing protein n=1 Tax=Flavicella marina TaxID=1475951 RepID=UPI001263E895|nr:DUF58 domain-containing protein [Flavicella marina]
MKESSEFPENVFVSLESLLKMERVARGFSFLANKQRVKSILGGKNASKLRGRGLDFEEVRNYVPGDDVRNIDWKVTARTQKTHLRVFTEEKEKPALIIVDQTKSMFFGSKVKTKSVVAAELAAMAAFKVAKEGDRVGGIVFGDNGVDAVLPKRNKKNILFFFEKLVKRNRELRDSSSSNFEVGLNEVFQKIRNIITHDFLIFIIGDFHRYSESVVKEITYMAAHNDVILAKVVDPLERNIIPVKYVGGNGKEQLSINGEDQRLVKDFQKGFDKDYRAFEKEMSRHKIPLFQINTVDDVSDQIQTIFNGTA